MKMCCQEGAVYWNPYNKVIQCHVCGLVHDKEDEKLNGVSPHFVVTEKATQVLKYWCIIEMENIQGDIRVEHHEDIDLQDFETLYGGITENIISIDLQLMPKQIID